MQDDDMGYFTPSSLIVNIPEDCGYDLKFEHNLDLKDPGVSAMYVNWCNDNCLGRWGWWFERDLRGYYTNYRDHSNAFLSFENEEDLVLFSLTHDITHKHTK